MAHGKEEEAVDGAHHEDEAGGRMQHPGPSANGSWIEVCGMAATTPAATDMRSTGTHHVRLAGGSSR